MGQFQWLQLLHPVNSMLRMSLDNSVLDTKISILPEPNQRMLLVSPEEVTNMLMPMEFSRQSITFLMMSMDSELLPQMFQLPHQPQLLPPLLPQSPQQRHLKLQLLELNILLLMRKPKLLPQLLML